MRYQWLASLKAGDEVVVLKEKVPARKGSYSLSFTTVRGVNDAIFTTDGREYSKTDGTSLSIPANARLLARARQNNPGAFDFVDRKRGSR